MADIKYDEWERECERIRERNADILEEFRTALRFEALVEKTINNHIRNIEFYINHFLLYEDAIEAQDGYSLINSFLGYWFPRKAMWASPSSIRSNITSLKKFYSFLHSKEMIENEDFEYLKLTIKESKDEWIENVSQR